MDLEALEAGHTIDIYESPTCPYCREARAHFDGRGLVYTVHDAQNDPEARRRMFSYTNDDPTVPAILVDGAYVQSGWGSPPRG
ncbi:MAG: glutaredoxin family protein [Candidatus Velthaea sp.]